MEQVITVEPRQPDSKGGARRLRRSGKVPGILYGHKEKARAFAVEPAALRKAVAASGFGRNTILRLKGLEHDCIAVIREMQMDPVRPDIVHVDLLEISPDQELTIDVRVKPVGKPIGVTLGGVLQMVRNTVRVKCKPSAIPHLIEVDVTGLEITKSVSIGELKLPPGLTALEAPALPVVTVHPPRVVEETTTAAAGAAGTTPGATAEGAAAAPAAPAAEKKAEKK